MVYTFDLDGRESCRDLNSRQLDLWTSNLSTVKYHLCKTRETATRYILWLYMWTIFQCRISRYKCISQPYFRIYSITVKPQTLCQLFLMGMVFQHEPFYTLLE